MLQVKILRVETLRLTLINHSESIGGYSSPTDQKQLPSIKTIRRTLESLLPESSSMQKCSRGTRDDNQIEWWTKE